MKPAGISALLLIPLLLIVWVYSRTPAADSRIRNSLRALVEPTPALAVGARLEAPSLARLNAAQRPKGWLLLLVGPCSECLADEVRAWERSARRRAYRLVVVTTSEDATQDSLRAAAGLQGDLVRDEDGKLAGRLGASFTPRAFLFGPDWKLVAVQKRPFPDLSDPLRDLRLAPR